MTAPVTYRCRCGWTIRTKHPRARNGAIARHVCGDGPPCLRCGRATARRETCRGLCRGCFEAVGPEGRADYERRIHPADELLDDWDLLRREGYTVRQAAERIGVTFAALDQALVRAKRRGDPRAVRPGTMREVAA